MTAPHSISSGTASPTLGSSIDLLIGLSFDKVETLDPDARHKHYNQCGCCGGTDENRDHYKPDIYKVEHKGGCPLARDIPILRAIGLASDTPALPSGEVELLRLVAATKAMYDSEWGHGAWEKTTRAEQLQWEVTFKAGLDVYLASSLTPQIAGDVLAGVILAALSPQPQPPFSRWADTIEAASLAISPKGSKELDALAAEVRAGGAAQAGPEPQSLHGMIAAIYGELDAEDCAWVDREWIKWRGRGTITSSLSSTEGK